MIVAKKNDSCNKEHDCMALIAPIILMQAKSTVRGEQSEEASEGKRHSEGMLSRNTTDG